MDAEGWLKTGDVGYFPEGGGGMRIVGRVKDSFKLSQGEFVQAAKVEGRIKGVRGVDKCAVVGRGTERFAVALCQMDEGWEGTEEDLLEKIKEACAGLSGYEVPRAVRTVPEMSVEVRTTGDLYCD